MYKNILVLIIITVDIVNSQTTDSSITTTAPLDIYTTSTTTEAPAYFDYYDEFGPQHCTKYHKATTFSMRNYSYYKMTYPTAYMLPRQDVVFILLWCVMPVSTELIVKVCDWLEAPMVDIALHETHLVIMRRDNNEKKFLGNAIINITQHCPHRPTLTYSSNVPYFRRRVRAIHPPVRDYMHKELLPTEAAAGR